MSERPIWDVLDAVLRLLDDHVEAKIQPVVTATHAGLDRTKEAVGDGTGRRESRLRRDIGTTGAQMIEELQAAQRAIVMAIGETLGDLYELRDPSADADTVAVPATEFRVLTVAGIEKLRTPTVIKVSTASGRNIGVLSDPRPDSVIVVDGDTAYVTDDHGRVEAVEAILWTEKPEQPRNETAERTVKGRLPGDHAGHIIARILGGVGDSINLVPMTGLSVNLGQYRRLERRWQRAVRQGRPVEVEVQLVYDDNDLRPSRIYVWYEIDGQVSTAEILNTPRAERSV